jgi:hypothetical protein
MEDSSPAQKAVSEVFVTELGWSVRKLSNSREVEDTVKSFPNYFYILDNKIGNKENEGLTALELIHGVSPKAIVAMWSAFSNNRKKAEKIHGNTLIYEVKTTRLIDNARRIALEFINYSIAEITSFMSYLETSTPIAHLATGLPPATGVADQSILQILERLSRSKADLERLLSPSSDSPSSDSPLKLSYEKNKNAFHANMDREDWREEYRDQYVAFVDGKQVLSDIKDERMLREEAKLRYPNDYRFITKVKSQTEKSPMAFPSGYSKFVTR